jgi:hypothetical protein
MKLRIGDKVRFLNEVGEGIITRFKDKETVFVEMHDGFEIPYLCKHLVPIHTELILNPEVENIEMELETILSDSIYFIIEPDHEMPALVTDYKFYLFNSSSYNVLFSYSVKDDEYFQTLKHGELGAYQKVFLKQVKKNFFKEYAYHKIECLFYKNMHYKSQIPLAEILYINDKIMSQSTLIQHNEFKFPVYAYILKENFLDKEVVEKTIKDTLEWLEQDHSMTEYEDKHKEIEGVLMPIIQKASMRLCTVYLLRLSIRRDHNGNKIFVAVRFTCCKFQQFN